MHSFVCAASSYGRLKCVSLCVCVYVDSMGTVFDVSVCTWDRTHTHELHCIRRSGAGFGEANRRSVYTHLLRTTRRIWICNHRAMFRSVYYLQNEWSAHVSIFSTHTHTHASWTRKQCYFCIFMEWECICIQNKNKKTQYPWWACAQLYFVLYVCMNV